VGTPEQVVKEQRSFTGYYLRPLLERADGSTQGLGGAAEAAAPRLGVALAEAPKRGRRKKVVEGAE
jgi:hypothetical protein